MILYLCRDQKSNHIKLTTKLPRLWINTKKLYSFYGNENAISWGILNLNFEKNGKLLVPLGIPEGACWKISFELNNDEIKLKILDKNVKPEAKIIA